MKLSHNIYNMYHILNKRYFISYYFYFCQGSYFGWFVNKITQKLLKENWMEDGSQLRINALYLLGQIQIKGRI